MAVATASLSCASKGFVGLKSQSSSQLGYTSANLSVGFHTKLHKSLHFRSYNKPSRARINMMPIGVPRVPIKSPGEGAWQWVDLWNALYRERVIYVGQSIDEEFSNQILATMLYLDSVDQRKMFLYISCPGGDISPSMGLFDTMQSLTSPVGTVCLGYAYDLAGFILAAGVKGSRAAFPLSRVALQSPAGAARGQADDVRNEASELLRIRDYLYKELAQMTGQSVEKIHKDLSSNNIKRFTSAEALEYGLIDRIIRPTRIKPDAPPRKEMGAGLR
ncbi:hypothetical protein GIB67_035960 [Kingdonia uniflora]|uniref:ATP-dependent Clp protease proteolytic subunit n=1 Tax=Kingdonia uniflora TaxID=39325 RepID=A0A7J7N0N8_9MAGN|nr:hypothetical protein GIB67_035960 [Kingdonia uniflora]